MLFLLSLYTLLLHEYNCLSLSSDTSTPVGQMPSIVYAAREGSSTTNSFLIYNSAQGLESIHCYDDLCDKQTRQTLKCDTKIYSSSMIALTNSPSQQGCSKYFDDISKKLYCWYYIVIGYGSLTESSSSSVSSVSFITCYGENCDRNYMNEIVIDTSFDDNSLYPFGYATSISTYFNGYVRYPMFTYSKYDHKLNKYVLNTIICLSFECDKWIGKEQPGYVSTPPYVILGILYVYLYILALNNIVYTVYICRI